MPRSKSSTCNRCNRSSNRKGEMMNRRLMRPAVLFANARQESVCRDRHSPNRDKLGWKLVRRRRVQFSHHSCIRRHLRQTETHVQVAHRKGNTNKFAITEDGKHCIVAAWFEHGVAAYSTEDGKEVWRRKDLKKVQYLTLSGDDRVIFCGFDGLYEKRCEFVDRKSGKALYIIDNAKNVVESPYSAIRLVEHERFINPASLEFRSKKGDPHFEIPRETFAVLAVAFAPKGVCVAEAGGSVRCINLPSGTVLWTYVPPSGTHCIGLAYHERLNTFFGVSYSYQHEGHLAPKSLVRFDDSGHTEPVVDLTSSVEVAFCKKGSRLITDMGRILDVATGKVVREFDDR